jgi:DNA mismatch endonuclease (patch repair protein)
MTDIVDAATRSRMMSGIRGKDTAPERAVRSFIHRAGLRFRIHRKDLPGTPDITLPQHRAVVLVHGCFWHRHPGCPFAYTPASRQEFWSKKFAENVARDRRKEERLRDLGWRVFVIWECEVDNARTLARLVARIRGGRRRRPATHSAKTRFGGSI